MNTLSSGNRSHLSGNIPPISGYSAPTSNYSQYAPSVGTYYQPAYMQGQPQPGNFPNMPYQNQQPYNLQSGGSQGSSGGMIDTRSTTNLQSRTSR